jgi:glycosyltransferase involved in cell wall biosynthesis
MMKWLFVAADAWPISNGTALRVWHLCRNLRLLGDEVAVLSDMDDDDFSNAYEREGISVFRPSAAAPLRRSRWDPFAERPAMMCEVGVRSGRFDVVVLSAPSSLQYGGAVARGTPVVADMIDDPILETRRRLWSGVRPLKWMQRLRLMVELRRYERGKVRPARGVFFVSDADRDSFFRRNPAARVFTSPNGVDVDYWAAVAQSAVKPASTNVVFVGNLSFYPNVLAAKTLICEIAPQVWRRQPEVRFRLVGGDAPAELVRSVDRRVEFAGRVPDVRPYVQSAVAVCIPMTAGTGIKNKFLEAWAAGRAAVATPLACQGLPVVHETNALIAKRPKDFARQICRLVKDADLRSRIGKAGREAVESRFSWDRIAREFRARVVEACTANGPAQQVLQETGLTVSHGA